jgi:hypothetical protein
VSDLANPAGAAVRNHRALTGDSGYFWFFSDNVGLVKVLDACARVLLGLRRG